MMLKSIIALTLLASCLAFPTEEANPPKAQDDVAPTPVPSAGLPSALPVGLPAKHPLGHLPGPPSGPHPQAPEGAAKDDLKTDPTSWWGYTYPYYYRTYYTYPKVYSYNTYSHYPNWNYYSYW